VSRTAGYLAVTSTGQLISLSISREPAVEYLRAGSNDETRMASTSVNRCAMELVQTLLDSPEKFKVGISTLETGTTLIDAGIDFKGGFLAGKLIGEICMGGLGTVELTSLEIGDMRISGVQVTTDHPLVACVLSQLAGWPVKIGRSRALGSGPARALAQVEDLYDEYPYEDDHSEGVLVMETSKRPDARLSRQVSGKCGISPADLYIIVTPTSSPAGVVQICSRVVETGMHKMHSLGIGLDQIVSGTGSCPVPPISQSDLEMMGRTNDAILYGGMASYLFAGIEGIAEKLESTPSSSSPDYGKPFLRLFEEAGRDFYKLDRGLFSPASVQINDRRTGELRRYGKISPEILRNSFGII